MKIPTLRALRRSLALLLACAALTLAAGKAHAQLWSEPVCMDPQTVPGLFSAMDFSGLEKCESLCKYTLNLCKTFVKDAASCVQTDAKGYWTLLDKIECDPLGTPEARKSCHSEVNGMKSDSKDSINASRQTALSQCEVILTTCLQGCSSLPI